jgi:hypothetical protein
MLDQGCEVGDILKDASLAGGPLALAVAAPVVTQDSERLRQRRDDRVPVVE